MYLVTNVNSQSVSTKWIRNLGIVMIVTALPGLTGCGAVHTMIKKRNLDVQTKMSDTIFLEPVSPAKRTIYVSIRNTSDKQMNVKAEILNRITQGGFRITDDPEQANYMLQANILQAGRIDLRSLTSAHDAGFGGAILGATVSSAAGGHDRSITKGALIGAAAGVIGDALVSDVLYSMITDIEVRERPRKGEVIVQEQNTRARQGSSTTLKQNVTGGEINWKIYRSRIVSTANQVNLEFIDARQPLEEGLYRSIAGVFAN